MNRDRAKELLPIIQAFVDGKEIQYRSHGHANWVDVRVIYPNDGEYRIKPESREWWLNTRTAEAYVTKECAEKFALGEKIVHLREVIE